MRVERPGEVRLRAVGAVAPVAIPQRREEFQEPMRLGRLAPGVEEVGDQRRIRQVIGPGGRVAQGLAQEADDLAGPPRAPLYEAAGKLAVPGLLGQAGADVGAE